jgi:hypothetical protein
MRPKINENHEPIPNYYNIDNLDLDNIRHKIKFCDCENVGISYGQFIKGIELNNTFDYHIFTEDDYLPFKDYFEDDLITELNNIEKDSFLCLYIKKNVLWNIKDYLSSENSNLLENKFSKFNISVFFSSCFLLKDFFNALNSLCIVGKCCGLIIFSLSLKLVWFLSLPQFLLLLLFFWYIAYPQSHLL